MEGGVIQLDFADLARNPMGVQMWWVCGMPGEDRRAMQPGIFEGYVDGNTVQLRFSDGKREYFSPHQLLNSPPECMK